MRKSRAIDIVIDAILILLIMIFVINFGASISPNQQDGTGNEHK